jgi:hypothetical protein
MPRQRVPLCNYRSQFSSSWQIPAFSQPTSEQGKWSSSAQEQIISGLGEELAGDRQWARIKLFQDICRIGAAIFCAGLQAIAVFLNGRALQEAASACNQKLVNFACCGGVLCCRDLL